MRRLASLALFTLLAATAGAQESRQLPPEVQAGARVRASAPGAGTVTGRVVAVEGDAFQVARDRAADTVRLVAQQLTSLDLSVGRHKRRWLGAGIGFLGGAALGTAVGAATYQKPENCQGAYFCDFGPGADMALGAILLGTAGAVTGAIVGAGRADDWKPLPLRNRTSLELRLPRGTGRLAVAAALRF